MRLWLQYADGYILLCESSMPNLVYGQIWKGLKLEVSAIQWNPG